MYSQSSLNIRAAASADAEKLGTFSAGDSVTVISSENGWSKIDYNGTEAYVASDYLSDTQPTAAPARYAGSIIVRSAGNYGMGF